MNPIIAGCLILGVSTLMADARGISVRTYADLERNSDIVVVARPLSTGETEEKTVLRGISPDIHVVGLSSEFEVIAGLKGSDGLKKVIVHHYRRANPDQLMLNGPMLASFDSQNPTRYLLFLQRESDGRYAPFNQVDPIATAMFGVGVEWEKMTPERFKTWMDAQRWLRERPEPFSVISSEIPPMGSAEGSLHEAAMNGKLEKAKALLKANPDLVFSHDSYGELTPLQFAAQYGHKDVAELLLANHAEVEAKSYGGWTPLLNAVFGGHRELVELLLKSKAQVNYQENGGRSALHVAAENSYTDIAALLLANGADVNARSREGYTPLHVAAVRGAKDLLDLLVANKAEYGIQDAAAIGDSERVKVLLRNNPDSVFSKDVIGSTALHWAVTQGRKDIVELLLANKADANARAEKSGWTPLHMAVMHRYKEIAEMLEAAGAVDPN